MLFNSLEFLAFAAVVFPIYFALRPWSLRTVWLLVASWLFYASWSPRFLLLLIATTWVDFQFAKIIHRTLEGGEQDARRRARGWVVLSLTMNLGALAVFKYSGFLYGQLAHVIAMPPTPAWMSAPPPLGISFYTFHSISYIIDTYRGRRPPTYVFREFALYVAFFPQLIAGPITRWGFMGPQIQSPHPVTSDNVDRGMARLLIGLVKKVALADSLGAIVDQVYGNVHTAAPLEIAIALYAYPFQIYFDFSGYTDMALGLAQLLGFNLPENFQHPYRALSPREFWQRWHISLSTWLRDYLYVSLGGNRRGAVRTMVNLMITMLLGGLWHGAAWTFVLWGGFHGAWLAIHRLVATGRPPRTPAWLRLLVTFHLVLVAWVLFRAPSLELVRNIFSGLFSGRPMTGPMPVGAVLVIAIGILTHALAERFDPAAWWMRAPRFAQGAVMGVVIIIVGLFSAQSQRFIYFQF
jgi:D-alanyl-lipoteichoic acid acyltransferase DltB (MBOAT superfamily)